ncbi:MAG: formylglycine-generating enzyme family protein [Treponema sp.]|jgi:formylglycine-generating enzyme required for sulfatase activity|nr:formylglycine-generating enzyme family protein [Treponema sp.]
MKKMFVFLFISLGIAAYGQQNNMALIRGGIFTMGSPVNELGRSGNEGPEHQVTVGSFFMGRYPVTQAEYQEVTGRNPSAFKGSNLPVEQVSWFDAVEYCNKLSIRDGFIPAYIIDGSDVSWNLDANGYRLPTEAEWEYACRAGTQTPFYSGISADEAGWHFGNSTGKTHPVGEKQPNPWGLYDMHGNVLEWCWDWFGNYAEEAQTNPQGASSGANRVYRGGCWSFTALQTRSAYRFGNKPGIRTYLVGFRVARRG